MAIKEGVVTKDAPSSSFLSQAVKCNGMVYCAGSIGVDPKTNKMVEGTIADRTVCPPSMFPFISRVILI